LRGQVTVAKNENSCRRLQSERIIVGIVAAIVIELPIILLISFLAKSGLISFFVYYIGLLSVGIGGLCAALVIAELYMKRKNLKR